MNFQTMSKQRKMILIAAAVGIISMFLPWVSAFGFSVNGMHGWGVLVFFCFVAAGLLAYMGDQTQNLNRTNWMMTLIAGGIAALIMVINFINALEVLSAVGIGFYLSLGASLAIVALTFMNRAPEDNLQNGFDSLRNSIGGKINTQNTGTTTTTTSPTTNVAHTTTNDPTRPTV